MAWLRRIRPMLYLAGGLLVIGSLLGARLLTHGGGGGTSDSVKDNPQPTAKQGSGPIFLGYADSNPSPIGLGLSPVLQSGEIVKLYVEPGQEVKVHRYRIFGGKVSIGDPLYTFNSRILEEKLSEAQRGVDVAVANLRKAKALVVQHETSIEAQKLKIAVAKDKEERTLKGYQLYESNVRETRKGDTDEQIKRVLANDPEFFKIETAYRSAVLEQRAENAILKGLETADTGSAVAIAEAEIRRVEALVDEARTAVDMCTVRTKVNGTIERINFGPGDVIGISTRLPVMILVPSGPRIVRAEIEADFAHRVGRDKIGKEVTIYDNTDPKITYKGKVERIGDTFLPKRSSADSLAPSDTRVLEAVIVVENAYPAGVPPLRVGQKVRVNFGQ